MNKIKIIIISLVIVIIILIFQNIHLYNLYRSYNVYETFGSFDDPRSIDEKLRENFYEYHLMDAKSSVNDTSDYIYVWYRSPQASDQFCAIISKDSLEVFLFYIDEGESVSPLEHSAYENIKKEFMGR